MDIATPRWRVLFVLASLIVFGACSSGNGGADGGVGSGGNAGMGSGGNAGKGSGGTGGGIDSTADGGGGSNVATMFVPDDLASAVYRYSVTPNADPAWETTISVPSAVSVSMRSGELFVTSYAGQAIYRFLSPFEALTPNGKITSVGLASYVEGSTLVDDELWIADYAGSNVIELSFDGQGAASVAGTVSVFQPMGMFWDSTSRILYVSEPSVTVNQVQSSNAPLRTIQHYQVSTARMVTALAPIAVANPYGMVVAPWGELFVADSTGTALSRFAIDAQGNATANGTVTGNGLNYPLSLNFTPWGELFVGNQGTGAISRFTFDSSHNAVPNGTFQTKSGPAPNGAGNGSRMDWISIFPGASGGGEGGVGDGGTRAAGGGGTGDGGVGTGGASGGGTGDGGAGAGANGGAGTGAAGSGGVKTAITVPVLGHGFSYYQGAYSLGWAFVVNTPIQVTSLGFYDDMQNGLTQSHPVGIFDKATMTLLGSVTVSPTDPLTGFFRYASLTTPIALSAGKTYVAMADVGSESYLAFYSIDPMWTVDPAITYAGSGVYYASTSATTLIYPDTFMASTGDFGPDFQFTSQ